MVSTGCIRTAKANNPYMNDFYNPNEPTSYIIYIDATNLYGHSMSQFLPEKNLAFLSDIELAKINESYILQMEDDGDIGMFFEIDLEIPLFQHDKFDAYPPAPYKRVVTEDEMCSGYMRNLMNDLQIKPNSLKTKKLIADLYNKEKYIVHFQILKTYLKIGCKLTKVHRAVKFHQSPWMKTYVKKNTGKRNEATSDFDKDFWKLLTNR
jgi:hypothetical protein